MSVPGSERRAAAPPVRRVLIYRLGSLGDTAVALPALHSVAQAFPGAERRLLTNYPVAAKAPAASAVLGGSGLVDSYERYTVGTRSVLQLAALLLRIRLWRPQVLVYLAAARGFRAARRDALFFRLCGIRRMIGLPATEDLQRNRTLPDGMREAESSRLLRTIAEIVPAEIARGELPDPLRLTPDEHARAEEMLLPLEGAPFLVASLGTKLQANQWSESSWKHLLSCWQLRHPEHALVLIGAADEFAATEALAAGWRTGPGARPVLNLCGHLSPRVSAAVCARAALFIGHDSGPTHLAAAAGARCVGIYSARHLPGIWFPRGRGHRVLYHPVNCMGCELQVCVEQEKKCILSISVDEVLLAAEEALRQAY